MLRILVFVCVFLSVCVGSLSFSSSEAKNITEFLPITSRKNKITALEFRFDQNPSKSDDEFFLSFQFFVDSSICGEVKNLNIEKSYRLDNAMIGAPGILELNFKGYERASDSNGLCLDALHYHEDKIHLSKEEFNKKNITRLVITLAGKKHFFLVTKSENKFWFRQIKDLDKTRQPSESERELFDKNKATIEFWPQNTVQLDVNLKRAVIDDGMFYCVKVKEALYDFVKEKGLLPAIEEKNKDPYCVGDHLPSSRSYYESYKIAREPYAKFYFIDPDRKYLSKIPQENHYTNEKLGVSLGQFKAGEHGYEFEAIARNWYTAPMISNQYDLKIEN